MSKFNDDLDEKLTSSDIRKQEKLQKKELKKSWKSKTKELEIEENKKLEDSCKKKIKETVNHAPVNKKKKPEKLVSRSDFKKINEDINSNHIMMIKRRLEDLEENQNINVKNSNLTSTEEEKNKNSNPVNKNIGVWKGYSQQTITAAYIKSQKCNIIENKKENSSVYSKNHSNNQLNNALNRFLNS